MFRTFLVPAILMGIIGLPMLYSHHQRHTAQTQTRNRPLDAASNTLPWQSASYRPDSVNVSIGTPSGSANSGAFIGSRAATFGSSNINVDPRPNFQRVSQPTSFPHPLHAPMLPATTMKPTQPNNILSQTIAALPASSVVTPPVAAMMPDNQAWAQPGMVPDFAKAETMVFPGDANGPDLSAEPMSFTPTIDLSSLFRFDLTKQWITSRWDRVSTSPADEGLHGMRVALVTGTNSWDLHGSLTYYFDANHRVQRITFRGWTGDASRLVQTLQQQVKIRAQPTHWAGLYLSKRSGLLMKHPAVIDKSNPVQQLALILEINNPNGNTPLSNDFQMLLPAAMATN